MSEISAILACILIAGLVFWINRLSNRQSKSETDLEDLEKLLEGLKKKMITSLVLD